VQRFPFPGPTFPQQQAIQGLRCSFAPPVQPRLTWASYSWGAAVRSPCPLPIPGNASVTVSQLADSGVGFTTGGVMLPLTLILTSNATNSPTTVRGRQRSTAERLRRTRPTQQRADWPSAKDTVPEFQRVVVGCGQICRLRTCTESRASPPWFLC